jgi:hypothetical protein
LQPCHDLVAALHVGGKSRIVGYVKILVVEDQTMFGELLFRFSELSHPRRTRRKASRVIFL